MRLIGLLLILCVAAVLTEGKRKRKFEGDFEFAEEDENKSVSTGDKKKWIHDPNNSLCKALSCKKKEICLLQDTFTAVCVSKKQIHKNGDTIIPKTRATEIPPVEDEIDDDDEDEDDDDDDVFYDTDDDDQDDDDEESSNSLARCKPCPIVKPTFLCGTDNRTYSSLCRLDYHNCIHTTSIRVGCKGFCPCKESELHIRKKQKQAERLNNLMNKYKNTIEDEKKEKERQQEEELGIQKNKVNNRNYDKYADNKYEIKEKNNKNKKFVEKKKGPNDKYTFTPEDLKLDNKHYKYIKYYKYDKELYGTKKPYFDDKGENEVVESKPVKPGKCNTSELKSMGNRLLDWFSVVMTEDKHRRQRNKVKVSPTGDFPSWCKPEVKWMMNHLDMDGDEKLSLQELYHLEHDHEEKCVKQFVDSCDTDRDILISAREWCQCFDKSDRPCAAVKRRSSPGLYGAYVPDCDGDGYYRSTQCHSAVGMCWCVDKHGIELPNSRTRGRSNCETFLNKTKPKNTIETKDEDLDDDDEDEGDDSDIEGSADQPVDF